MSLPLDPVAAAVVLSNVAQPHGQAGARALALALGRVAACLRLPLASVLSDVQLAYGASHV